MAKSLLIVESPTKARTLERYLGKDFIVKASVGHVKDLPGNKLGIDLDGEFKPQYQVLRGKKKIIDELRKAASRADAVYLGPDPDREGEAIAWHIAEEIGATRGPIRRVLFFELTRKAILEALGKPNELNRKLYEAQQARRMLDRLVGYMISPLLWEKVRSGLSAGRVQSVALRLICEREGEIRAFEKQEYWTIEVRLSPRQDFSDPTLAFTAQLIRCKKKKCDIASHAEAERHVRALKSAAYHVSSVEKKQRQKGPSPPFITSTLQQEAARKFHYSAKHTMGIAQRLYEGIEIGHEGAVGLITYMRTDSTRLSQDAVQGARDFISKKWGKEYLPQKPIVYKSRQSAQGAHEAIRPTDVGRTPESMSKYLTREQSNLYGLIWKRFVASQMASALIDQTTVDVSAGDYTLRAIGSVIVFQGFLALYEEGKDEPGEEGKSDERLPDLLRGQHLDLLGIESKQHFTQPPQRYTEATLIKTLEDLGIGRPSTYATIISTVLEREYVLRQKQSLLPTELGMIIDRLVSANFPDIVDVKFTANMEKDLDEIEHGGRRSQNLLSDFYEPFTRTLESARKGMVNLRAAGWPTDLACPHCSKPLAIRLSRSNGAFLACSGYPKCSFTSDYERDEKGHIHLVDHKEQTVTGEICEKCGKPMTIKRGRYGTFLACTGYPGCRNTRPISTGIRCPREGCGGQLVERMGKRGRFYGCNKYPGCKMLFQGEPVHQSCPSCKAPVLFRRQGKTGSGTLFCINPSCKFKRKEEPEQELAKNGRKGERFRDTDGHA
ncbi:MAG TPA: type I DNA topoisomerase [Syntrophobacteraceae bacterium]|nr:type I DNA topoisomerase [Syntrophobacteraceae bacterium]